MRFPITSEQCVHPETKATTVVYYLFGMRDSFNTSGANVEPYENGEFTQFIADINVAIRSIGFCTINVYMDPSGTNFALDSSGNPISNRLIKQTSYTYPYIDLSGNPVDGSMLITFDDGSFFLYSDTDTTENAYWYSIGGPNPIIYQFT